VYIRSSHTPRRGGRVCFGEPQTYKILQFILGCVISGFRPEVDENCAFWVITRRVVVIPYQRFGTTYRSQLQPIHCPETSVRNYHYSLCNSPKEHSSYFGIFRTVVFSSAEGIILRDLNYRGPRLSIVGWGEEWLSAPMAILFVDRVRLNHEGSPTKSDVW
jgi:hypothetical protein